MGADSFATKAKGKTAEEAFRNAVERACAEYGCGGYSGTIAEKGNHGYKVFEVPTGVTPKDFVYRMIDAADPAIDDKWGPAGCVKAGDDEWIFFGFAPS